MSNERATANAILGTLISVNVPDSNMEPANVVDVVDRLATQVCRVAAAITPNICGGTDANGGHVESLTEAVMGVTGGLFQIAEAINNLADAVRNRSQE